MKQENVLHTERQFEQLSDVVRQGVLFLCLLDQKIDLPTLADIVSSNEAIDELILLPFVQSDQISIWIDQEQKPELLANFKWSEKVKAAESLGNYISNKIISNENLGDIWLIAGNREKAMLAYLEALKEYRQYQDHKQNIRICEKLLKLNNLSDELELEVLNTLLVCHECCGESNDVIQTRIKILQMSFVQAHKEVYAPLLRAQAIDYSKQGSWNHYKKYREEAALIFSEINKPGEASIEFIALATRCIDEINLTKGIFYAEEALNHAVASDSTELICRAMAVKAYLLAMNGSYKQGQALAEEALQLALKNNFLETAAYVYRKLAGSYEYASDFEKAKIIYNEAIHFCEMEQLDTQVQMCYGCLSWIFFRLGEWKKAIEVGSSLISNNEINNPSKSTANCVIAIIKSLRGEIRSAEKYTKEGIFLAQKEQFMMIYHLLHLPMAKINELKGNIEGAKEWYCKIIDDWPQTNEKHDVLISLMDAAMFFHEQNDAQTLKKTLEIFSYISKETGNAEAIGCMAYGLGIDALLHDNPEGAVHQLKIAHKYIEKLNVPYQLILIEYHLGISFLQLGETVNGEKVLRDILPRAKNMGLAPMVSKLTKAIDKAAPGKNAGLDSLTPRQLDVLQLMADGLANKEIAARLFLSTRTVDMHIRYIFEKFYCRTRTEAVKIGKEKGLIQ
jgi:DNA-binding CsgD family transcriptional regulator